MRRPRSASVLGGKMAHHRGTRAEGRMSAHTKRGEILKTESCRPKVRQGTKSEDHSRPS
jgi:hypothetical protein